MSDSELQETKFQLHKLQRELDKFQWAAKMKERDRLRRLINYHQIVSSEGKHKS